MTRAERFLAWASVIFFGHTRLMYGTVYSRVFTLCRAPFRLGAWAHFIKPRDYAGKAAAAFTVNA